MTNYDPLVKRISDQVKDKRYRYTAEYFNNRRAQRTEYINLFKAKKLQKITASQQARLDQLEWTLSVEDIVLFRSLAEMQLKKEGAMSRPNIEGQHEGWMKRFWGGWTAKTGQNLSEADNSPTMDSQKLAEAQQELLEALNFDFVEPKAVDSFIEKDVCYF
jgi:vacuolar protein sorting-associated protein 13A/C